jgi:hypothetical protein
MMDAVLVCDALVHCAVAAGVMAYLQTMLSTGRIHYKMDWFDPEMLNRMVRPLSGYVQHIVLAAIP